VNPLFIPKKIYKCYLEEKEIDRVIKSRKFFKSFNIPTGQNNKLFKIGS